LAAPEALENYLEELYITTQDYTSRSENELKLISFFLFFRKNHSSIFNFSFFE